MSQPRRVFTKEQIYESAWYSDTVAVPTFTDTFENYTYDKYGNWVTRDETIIARWTGQVSTSTITREMEYFE